MHIQIRMWREERDTWRNSLSVDCWTEMKEKTEVNLVKVLQWLSMDV